MTRTLKRIACSSLLSLTLILFTQGVFAANIIPVESFAKTGLSSVRLSPDGKKFAALVSQEGTTVLMTQTVEQADAVPVVILSTDNRERQFRWVRWVNNDRLLVSMYFASKRKYVNTGVTYYQHDSDETRLISVKADGTGMFNVIKPRIFTGNMQAQIQDRIVDMMPANGHQILLQVNDGEVNFYPAVYEINVDDGSYKTVHSARPYFVSWEVDETHQVRVGMRREKGNIEIHVCDPDGKNWRKAWAFRSLGDDAIWPLGFGKDPNTLYVTADNKGRNAIFTVDLRDPSLKLTLKLAHDKSDLDGNLIYSAVKQDFVGINVDFGSSADTRFWDPDFSLLMSDINEVLPNRSNFLGSKSADETKYFISSSNSATPPELFFGDKSANKLGLFSRTYPELNAQFMSPKKSVTIETRDNIKLPAFLTLPNVTPVTKLPTILLVHGGPQGHDDLGFDPWAQFLANRGYAVLQVNFRGSTGYGKALRGAGLRRWGMEMQDDLSDAAKWIVKQGIADADRISIVGASYGGYAALMGAAKTPELFRSAVSFAGVSDLVELGLDNDEYTFEQQVGSLDTERKRLRETSPINFASNFKIPLLLIHGTKDRSVAYSQSTDLVKALSDAGNTSFRFISQEFGDHHLSIYEHRLQFFTELEKFLAENMSVRK